MSVNIALSLSLHKIDKLDSSNLLESLKLQPQDFELAFS